MLSVLRMGMVLLVGLVVLASGAAQAGKHEPLAKWWHMPRLVQELGLTDQEAGKLDRLHLEMSKKRIDSRAAKEQAQLMIDSLFNREPLDEAAIQEQFNKLAAAQTDLIQERYRFMLESRNILGLERFQKLRALFRELRAHEQQPQRPHKF